MDRSMVGAVFDGKNTLPEVAVMTEYDQNGEPAGALFTATQM
jgi:hypothetical protein